MSVHISSDTPLLRHDWQREELLALFDLPFPDLLHRAATVHRAHFDPAEVAAVRWVEPAELDRETAAHPEAFTPWFKLALARAREAL